MEAIISDKIILSPSDIDLSNSPLRKRLDTSTYVLGAFNPGLCRLANGNLLMMVRVAEALSDAIVKDKVHCIRWEDNNYTLDAWNLADVTMDDPRKFRINEYNFPVFALTSISWLLPVELNEDGSSIVQIHYDKIIAPTSTSQEYGIEDARISAIEGRYYMTTCCVSSERHSTMLYVSDDGLNYNSLGIVLDHQNKDMLLFEGKISDQYYALTRPLGECYFASPPNSLYHPGAAIHLSTSPDLLHWKPSDKPFLRARKSSLSNVKIGGGTPPVLTSDGWLMLYHGVENNAEVGTYRTFWALLDKQNPSELIYLSDNVPLLEANPGLTSNLQGQVYLNDVVFTTGIASYQDEYILASGELDLACRITRVKKEYFSGIHHK
jgi:beta-1,2-mannobiose phosphorylase / 1,2-beta-oligomannan phosphorylase